MNLWNKPKIPSLKISSLRPDGRSIAFRSYPIGRENYHRIYQHSSFEIRVHFGSESNLPDRVLVFMENLATGVARPCEIPMRGQGKEFQVLLPTNQSGLHRFKIKYRQGGSWYWDQIPYSYFIVDPKRIQDMRIYTFIPTTSGHMGEWVEDLKRIKDLGFNTIHMLPLTKMDVSESPYAAVDLFDVDPAYLDPSDSRGGMRQFEKFVAEVNRLDLSLCLDLVLNNVGVHSKIARHRADWVVEDVHEKDGIKRAGWSDGKKWHKWVDLALINYDPVCNHSRQELWNYMTDYALFWSQYAAGTNGMIRLDNLHSSHETFMHTLLGRIRQAYPDLVILGELFDNEERTKKLVLDYGLHLILATPWEHKFVPELRKYLQHVHSQGDKLHYYFPISSHDSGSPAEEFGDVCSTIPRLVVSSLFGPGPSGITQGVEFGCKSSLEFIGRQQRLNLKLHEEIVKWIKQLNDLTEGNASFHFAGNLKMVDENHHAILGGCRMDPVSKEPRFFVFANLDVLGDQHMRVHLKPFFRSDADMKLNALANTGTLKIEGEYLSLWLPACGVCVLAC